MIIWVKSKLRRFRILSDLVGSARRWRALLWLPLRPWRVRKYFATHQIRKLQIGSGATILDGWLCTDYEPVNRHVLYLDATRKFPFPDKSFDYVYSEHMIEHISHNSGLFMLRESYRVLKPGGAIRIATPDLAVLLGLYTESPDRQQQDYLEWIAERYLNADFSGPVYVINNAFRNWGHQFLYDGEALQVAMLRAGFDEVRRLKHSESDDSNLRCLESHGVNLGNQEANAFETMVFEGKRLRE